MPALMIRRLSALLLRGIARGRAYAPLMRVYAWVPAPVRAGIRRRLTWFAGGMRRRPVVAVRANDAKTIAPADWRPRPQHHGAGVNLYGYVRGGFGLAENMRLYARALLSVGYPTTLLDAGIPIPGRMLDDSLAPWIGDTPAHPVNLCFVNPDQFPAMREHAGSEAFTKRYTIGFWLWELERIPEAWLPVLDLVDEIWVPTSFVQQAFRKVTRKPVTCVPMAIDVDPGLALGRRDLGLEEGCFTFLFSFDFHSYFARKNPMAVIDAFCAAFPPTRGDVRLVIKSINGERFPDQLAQLASMTARDRRIMLHDGFLDRGEMFAFLACADAYVSLHRAEGIGLGLAESMYLGKPVIATGYSGNLDFMSTANSCLVDFHMVDVQAGEYAFTEGQQWAEPDVEAAAAHMRRLADHPEQARALGAAAAASVRERLSRARCAEAAVARLREIAALRTTDTAQETAI
ncbi:MAG: glycosyltransferase family 4 protein [Mizugakiibacter sp.]|uniref:glycosyltransferase family 4 protein n=1 Tax=Mizugakiibacter sp. TaxID=1972610 RepID=UPI0031C24B44|nr:glycosyltransferase family 4 protein [Xanthomonadaceae bacterium]